MIIRPSHSRKLSLLQRFFRPLSAAAISELDEAILSAPRFELEVAKEAARVNRRAANDRCFSLISILPNPNTDQQQLVDFACRFRNGLRLTDSIGWMDNQLAVLLPETDVQGAAEVANQFSSLAREDQFEFDTEILAYPKDDELVQRANDLIQDLAGIGKVVVRVDEEDQNDSDMDGDDLNHKDANHEGPNHNQSGRNGASHSKPNALESESAKRQVQSVRLDRPFNYSRFMAPLGRSFKTPLWKRGIDVLCSGAGLVVLSPVFLVTAVAIKRNSPGPVFFRQRREGKDGHVFEILKFRTMGVDAESLKDDLRSSSEQDGPAFKLENDPRITSVGKYLRKSCVDELPQLVNVFKGDMSLVGPRPLPIDESVQCTDWQRYRLRVLPGITCIWQAEGGRDTQFDDWMRMDLRYIRQRSFLFDMKMIFKTVFIALLHKGSV